MKVTLKPVEYLTKIERYLLRKIEEDIKNCEDESELILLKEALDELLETSISRYVKHNS